MRMSGPDLAAVDDVVIAAFHGTGLEGRQIRARAGLRKALAPVVFPRKNLRQIMALLCRRSVGTQDGGEQLQAERRQSRGVCQSAFLFKNIALYGRPAGPSERTRPVVGEPSLLVEDALPLAADLRLREYRRRGESPVAQALRQMAREELPDGFALFAKPPRPAS